MFTDIIVNRFGTTANSYMRTVKILKTIKPNINYKILLKNLVEIEEIKSHINFNPFNKLNINEPKYIEIEGNWILENKEHITLNNSNILGNFGKLITESNINIPINIANYYNVQYYDAKLFNLYDIIKFDTEQDLPLTEMVIGDEYVKNFIEVEDLGGGQYLEYHNNPHFHSPILSSNSGYYILGKKNENKIKLSAFIIPFQKAIYTPGNIIHSDANLVGNWLVVYSKTQLYSSVLLRDKENKLTKILFV
jgi:hypothetical protein